MKNFLRLLMVTLAALGAISASAAPSTPAAQKHGWHSGARPAGPPHRHYYRPYYYYPARYALWGGYWGPSVGLFYSTLPFGYSRLWYGGVPYYYADDVYYVKAPGGYRVVPPPSSEGTLLPSSPSSTPPTPSFVSPTDALIITPLRGQTPAQKSFDRIDCERAAIKSTGYDPALTSGEALAKADYVKAVAACLTMMGYSVK